jgi:deoxyadenosine/deoxycytidine kinase
MSPTIISIEGNMGVGKTTFINTLKEYFKDKHSIHILEEPVSLWQNIKDLKGKDILSHFYEDQSKWAFSFQMMAYISRLAILKQAVKDHPDSIIITERSVHSDRHIFAKMLYDDKLINEIDYQIYNQWFDHFIEDIPITATIYLQCTPKISNQRVLKRARKGETIPLPYLIKCHQYHEEWLDSTKADTSNAPAILHVNCNLENTPETILLWQQQLEQFITPLIIW